MFQRPLASESVQSAGSNPPSHSRGCPRTRVRTSRGPRRCVGIAARAGVMLHPSFTDGYALSGPALARLGESLGAADADALLVGRWQFDGDKVLHY